MNDGSLRSVLGDPLGRLVVLGSIIALLLVALMVIVLNRTAEDVEIARDVKALVEEAREEDAEEARRDAEERARVEANGALVQEALDAVNRQHAEQTAKIEALVSGR